MPDLFRRAHHIVVEGGKYIAIGRDKVKNTVNITVNIIPQDAPPPNDAERPEALHPQPYISFSRQTIHRSLIPIMVILALASKFWQSDHSTVPASIPSAPPIFYGRDEVVDSIVKQILAGQRSIRKHIAIRGGPGMGKTSIGYAVINDKRIAKYFRDARYWVRCNRALTIQHLLEEISTALDPNMPKSNNRLRDIIFHLEQTKVPRIVGLDNFETIWDPTEARAKSEDILMALVPHLTILLTTRGHFPAMGQILWYELDPIEPLSLSAARQTFTSIRSKHIDDRLDDLLRAVDCVPQIIVLLASYGHRGFTTSQLLVLWNKEPRLLNIGQDHLSNTDISIRISLDSPSMKARPDSLIPLSIIAHLPDGIIYDNLEKVAADVVVPPLIWDIHNVARVLIDTSLVQHTVGVLQVHSTTRLYMRYYHPLNLSLMPELRTFYFLLAAEADYDLEVGRMNFLEPAHEALSRERRNVETIILNALRDRPDVDTISASIHYTNHLIWSIPSLEVPRSAIEAINNSPSREMDSLLPVCWLRLGKLYVLVDQYSQAIAASEEAEKAYERLNQWEGVARSNYQLAEVHRIRGNYSEAADLFTKAYKVFEVLGNSRDMSSCLRNLGVIQFENDNYTGAVQAIMNAQDACGPADDTCLIDSKRELGRVYRVRNSTEAIKLLTEARAYYLLNGPPFHAAICLYQKSIAHYKRGDHSQAERDLIQAHEDFKNLGNYGQMGFCVYHRAVLNARRGFVLKALELFEDSRRMFEEMDNPRMVAFSYLGRARMSAALCRMGDAEEAYTQALARLEKLGAVTHFQLELQKISYVCNLAQRYLTFGWYVVYIVVTICCVLFLRWTRGGWPLR